MCIHVVIMFGIDDSHPKMRPKSKGSLKDNGRRMHIIYVNDHNLCRYCGHVLTISRGHPL